MSLIYFTEQDDGLISKTNFWDSEPAQNGYHLLHFKDNSARLLTPDCYVEDGSLAHMITYPIISLAAGPDRNDPDNEIIQILFLDPNREDMAYIPIRHWQHAGEIIYDTEIDFQIFTREGCLFSKPTHIYRASMIPCSLEELGFSSD